jgi:hypothetical protein
MKTMPESFPLAERLRLSTQSAMNSRLPQVNSFAKGKANTGLLLIVSNDDEIQ